jgi:predicted nucleic acid-binding protein
LHQAADAAVRAAAAQHVFVVSVVTVAELLTGAKLGHHDEPTVRRFFAQMVSRRIPLDEPAAQRAAELRAAQKALKMPDALILATADLNADLALTGDDRGAPDRPHAPREQRPFVLEASEQSQALGGGHLRRIGLSRDPRPLV